MGKINPVSAEVEAHHSVVHSRVARALRTSSVRALASKKYVNSALEFFGATVPQQRAVGFTAYAFTFQQPPTVFGVWTHIFKNASHFEVKSQAIFFYEDKKRWAVLSRKLQRQLFGWAAHLENWAHSDGLSAIYSALLEESPKDFLPILQKWNRSPNPWLRRQSIVSLLYYVRCRKRVPSFLLMISMVEQLLVDPEYYVQKGVGWTLREIYQAYPQQTYLFLKKNVLRISPWAFSAACEKLSPQEKTQLSKLRKARVRGQR